MARPKLNPDTIELICKTCKNSFPVSYYLRNRRTYCSKKCANHDPEIIEKMITSQKETFNEKYGMHPMKTEMTKENLKAAIQKKYGVDWISKSDGWYNKVKETKIKLYGIDNYNNIEKIKKTCVERFGVDNPTKYKEIRESINETVKTNHYNSLVNFCNFNYLKVLFPREEYKGYTFNNVYKFQCTKCNYIFENSINNTFGSIYCEKCDPDKKKTLENDFFNFLTSLSPSFLITRHDRTILYGKELDFYLPEKKIAFELNGLYWHSENGNGILKNYHLNKTKGCLAHNVRLIHIFENEWRDKPDLIKSIIKIMLNSKDNDIIYARNCIIKEVDIPLKNKFLNENHLQGEDKTNIKLGLYNNDILVSVMTFSKSRFDKKVEWEISRFCNLKNTNIIGGADRLFKHFITNYKPNSIVSYCDRRIFSGNIYNQLGFRFNSNTNPSYHYITPDYKSLMNRMHFQKHKLKNKLKIFDDNLTEWENMKNNGWDRIWDCGNSKWVWTIH